MSASVSIVKNLDEKLKNSDGQVIELMAICEDNNGNPACLEMPLFFENDYELLFVLRRTFKLLKQIDCVNENIVGVVDDFELSSEEAELLKKSHALTNFLLSAYFELNGKMVRFEIDKEFNLIYFVNNHKQEDILYIKGNLIASLPDLVLQYNFKKLKKDLKVYKDVLKTADHCNLIAEKQTKLLSYEQLFFKRNNKIPQEHSYIS